MGTIYRDGERVGWMVSGVYGCTVGKSIGYGYVPNPDGEDADFVTSRTYKLEVRPKCALIRASISPATVFWAKNMANRTETVGICG